MGFVLSMSYFRTHAPIHSVLFSFVFRVTDSKLRPADASKVPPSRFQKRKGSIYATPSSRDGHVDRNYPEKYHAKIAEMKGRKSK